MTRPRFLPDNFTLTLIGVVLLASFLPASGQVAVGFGWLTNIAIALLFFLHGAKLSRQAILAGAKQAGVPLVVSGMTASCDAWFYNNQLGIPTVVYGAGTLKVAHSKEEHLALKDLANAGCVLATFVQDFCGRKA